MLKFITCLVNYGVVLLLGIVSLMAGSTTGVPISPGYGGHQQQYTQQPDTTLSPKCYTTMAPEYYKVTYAIPVIGPSYYAESPKYFSSPNFTNFTTPPPY
jgi:hypothetical protein